LISDSENILAQNKENLWDSKKVESAQSIQVIYKGKKLLSEMIVYWKVRVWDENGVLSNWSEPAHFEMGLFQEKDWQGNWIFDGKSEPKNNKEFYEADPAPYFRYTFKIMGSRIR